MLKFLNSLQIFIGKYDVNFNLILLYQGCSDGLGGPRAHIVYINIYSRSVSDAFDYVISVCPSVPLSVHLNLEIAAII